MSGPRIVDQLLAEWLEEGPTRGRDDGLAEVLSGTRSVRQRPSWLVTLRGGGMETPMRVRPSVARGSTRALAMALLALAVAAGALVVGALLLQSVLPPAPRGASAVLALSLPLSGNDDIYTVRADGSDLRRVTSGPEQEFAPAFSPDGTRIAFIENSSEGGYALWVADATGVHLLHDGIGCFADKMPAWSPDGRWIVYSRTRPGQPDCVDTTLDLFAIPADRSAPGRRLLAAGFTGFSASPAWSPSGDRIAFRGLVDGVSGLWVADVPDRDAPWDLVARRINRSTPTSLLAWSMPRWSPDGTTIATTVLPRDVAPHRAAVLVSADGSSERLAWRRTTSDHAAPEWSPDGSRIAVVETPGVGPTSDALGLRLLDARSGAEIPVAAPPMSGLGLGPLFSPDGSRVIGLTPDKRTLLVITLDGSAAPVSFELGGDASWQPVAASLDWAPLER
jgi:Tol biopolymer transport system component